MKRCPKCQFIYPDSDTICDFDKTTLIAAPESEIAAITNTPAQPAVVDLASRYSERSENRKNRRTLRIAALVGLLLSIAIVVVYFAVRRQVTPQPTQAKGEARSVVQAPLPSPSPSITDSPSPEQTVTTTSKKSPLTSETTAAHATSSSGPISTTAKASSVKTSRKPMILLASGGKIEADEVWRTQDGVWYRRSGLVTLLKKNRVKAIVSQ
jgi:hypothetical protein